MRWPVSSACETEHLNLAKKRQKRKKRGPLEALADGLLTLVDWVCEALAGAAVTLLRGIGKGILLLLHAMGRLVMLLIRALLAPFAWLLRRITGRRNRASGCLRLTGEEFEIYMAQVLRDNGFRRVEVTRLSGDQGVDILAERNGKSYAVQCKNYAGAVGNAAVQEAFAGAQFYGCDLAVVVCPGEFTRAARELADSTGVLLWDGERLSHMMRVSGRRPRHTKP